MKSTSRFIAIGLSLLSIAAAVSGCHGDDAPTENEKHRLELLTTVVEEFRASEISEVVCDVRGGEVGLKTGLTRSLVLKGFDSMPLVLARFDALNYEVTSVPPVFTATRTGLLVAGHAIESLGSDPELEAYLSQQGCPDIPTEGAVAIRWEDRPR